jgi:hypothetical protein
MPRTGPVLAEEVERRLRDRQPEDTDQLEEATYFEAPRADSGWCISPLHEARTLPGPQCRSTRGLEPMAAPLPFADGESS